LKQEDMAEKLGISVTAYGNIERDETDISHDRLEQIAKVLDLSIQDLLAFDEKRVFNFINNNDNSNQNVGATYFQNFPEELRKLYEDKIKLLEDKIEYQSKEIERLKK
jgi:transcriptional regulator with XRE-family HTH domain